MTAAIEAIPTLIWLSPMGCHVHSVGQLPRICGPGGLGREIAGVLARTAHIVPSSPWERGDVESFDGKLQRELLDR